MHAAFEVGVLKAILENIRDKNQFELVGLSGTSAGALCALMVWYGLESLGSAGKAIHHLEHFWEDFVAKTGPETFLNFLTFGALRAEESEVPVLGLYSLRPQSARRRLQGGRTASTLSKPNYLERNLGPLIGRLAPSRRS